VQFIIRAMINPSVKLARPELHDALFQGAPDTIRSWTSDEFQIKEFPARDSDPPIFQMEGTISAPLALVAAMIRESDLGSLAGSLGRWDVLESERSDPFRRRVFYISKLPFPFKDRAFYMDSWVERPGPDSLGIVSVSLPADRDVCDHLGNAAWGEIVLSGYYLVQMAPRLTWLRRLIGIELGLPMPRGILRRMLINVYRGNYKWMNKAARSDLVRRFEQRMANDPLYSSLQEN
jgi:hypothetical protein